MSSTSIVGIKAKPIIDIAVAVEDFTEVERLASALEAEGFPKLDEISNAENFTGPIRLYKKAGFVEAAKMDDRAVVRKTLEQTIENHIYEALTGDAQKSALAFVAHLRANSMLFEKGTGYWVDKRYWMAKYNDEYVCFILDNAKTEIF